MKLLPVFLVCCLLVTGFSVSVSAQVTPGEANLQLLGSYSDEAQLDSLYKAHNSPIVVIEGYAYLPLSPCVEQRKIGGDVEDRKLGGDAENRKLGGDNEGRKLGGDQEDRKLGGDAENRKLGGDNEGRKLGGAGEGRKLGGDAENRKLGGDKEGRKLGGDAEDRKLGGDNEGRKLGGDQEDRKLGGDAENRKIGGDTGIFKCKKLESRAAFEILNLNKNARVLVYDRRGLRKVLNGLVGYE